MKPTFWKLSQGSDLFDYSDLIKSIDSRLVYVHKNTKAKGTSNTAQGHDFINAKIGDYFYLTYGNEGIFLLGQLSGPANYFSSEQKGWIKFREEREFDIPALLLMADAFPPPVLASQGMVAWVPTIEFSVNVRRIPTSKWLKGIFRTRFITCGLLEEDGELWDENGELAAILRQIAQFRPAR